MYFKNKYSRWEALVSLSKPFPRETRNENRFCIWRATHVREYKAAGKSAHDHKSVEKYVDPDETLVFVYEILHNSHAGKTFVSSLTQLTRNGAKQST